MENVLNNLANNGPQRFDPDLIDHGTLAQLWADAKAASIAATNYERELRNALIAKCFPEHAPMETGTRRYQLSDDAEVKAVFTLNYKVNNEDDANTAIDKLTALGETGALIADRLFKWKPEISASEYSKLSAEMRAIVDDAITIKPGTTAVEIATPKQR